MKKSAFVLFFICLLPLASFSQVTRKQEMKEEEDPHKLIEAIKIWKISEFLELDDEQMVAFFPKLKRIEKHRRETFRQRHELLAKMSKQVEKGESEEALHKTIEQLMTFDKETREKELTLREEIMDVLSVTQQAKLLIFEERFEREIRNIIREMREHRREGGPPGDF